MSLTLASTTVTDPAEALRRSAEGLKLHKPWLGLDRVLKGDNARTVAQAFRASSSQLRTHKTILNTRNPRYRALTAVRSQATAYYQAGTLPYVEPGTRLVRRSDLDAMIAALTLFQARLAETAAAFAGSWQEVRAEARQLLADLYDPADYPADVRQAFQITWQVVSLEPPPYLAQLSPEVYAQEQAKVAENFRQALCLAEEQLLLGLHKGVSKLKERLTPEADGSRKRFSDSAVDNIKEFLQTFERFNLTGNADLTTLLAEAGQLVEGVSAGEVRSSETLRQKLLAGVSELADKLAQQPVIKVPRRKISRFIPASQEVAA